LIVGTTAGTEAALKRRISGAAAFARREFRIVAGLLAFALLAAAFLNIAEEVVEGDTSAIDLAILTALRQPGSPHAPIGPHWLTVAAADLTALGSIAVLGVVVLVVGGLFAAIGRARQALILVIASGGAVLWSQGLKALFDRARPEAAFHAVEVVNSSFPSGHAMLSASIYLTLGALASRFSPRLRIRVFALAAAILVTLVVGLSRVFLGVHWPTDVLAGWCVGAAWALGCWLAEGLWERRHGRP
jgi:undecaprenyl-diphosphatase